MTFKDENPRIVFDTATEEDYLRYINRHKVSDLQAAFLVSGYVPFPDFKLSNDSSREQRNVHEIYLFLKSAAEEHPHPRITKKDDTFFANLEVWTGYLFSKDHPVVESLIQAFLKNDKHMLSEFDEITTSNQIPQFDNKTTTLKAYLEMLDYFFPDFPYKYYMLFPLLKKTIALFNFTEKRFGEIASELIERPRLQGRPSKDIVSKYSFHAHLQVWFNEIEEKYGKEKPS